MMVAAHVGDLAAARSVGFRTAYVPRPLEYGDSRKGGPEEDTEADVVAKDFLELADHLTH
jgi:2-haloacid dehalogenase